MKRRLPALAAAILALVLIGGCGDDGSPGDQPGDTQTTEDDGGY